MPLVTILCTALASLLALNVAQTAIVLRAFHSRTDSRDVPLQIVAKALRLLEALGKRSFIYSRIRRTYCGGVSTFNFIEQESGEGSSIEPKLDNLLKSIVTSVDGLSTDADDKKDFVEMQWHIIAAGADLLFLIVYFLSLLALISYLICLSL